MKCEKPLPISSPIGIAVPVETLPIYTRRPLQGHVCPISGLNLSAIDKLIRPQKSNDFRPPVKSKRMFAKGATRPTILIEVRSLLEYLKSLPEATERDFSASHHSEAGQQTKLLGENSMAISAK
jgi:hypothetical protein